MGIMRIYCHQKYEECFIAPKKYWDKSLMKEMTGFAGWGLLGTTSSMVTNYGRSIVANNFFGTIVNASLGIVGQLNGQILAFSNNMMKAINPIIVKSEGAGERDNMIEISFTACKLSFLVYAVFAIPFFTESSYILQLWLKNVPQYTDVFFKIFIFQVLIEQVSLPLGTILSATGKIKGYNLWNTIIMLLSLLLMYLLFRIGFPPYSLMIVSLCSAILLMFVKIIYCKRHANMLISDYLIKILIPCILTTVIIIALSYFLKVNFQESFKRLFIIGITTTLSLFSLGYLFILSIIEKKLLIGLFHNLRKH
jgi:Na+-driven multidrug efflux pump